VDYITKPIQRLETLARTRTHIKVSRLLQIERMHNQQIEAIINNITDCVMVVDKQGGVFSANPTTENLFGYPEDQLCQKNPAELLNYHGTPDHFIEVLQDPQHPDSWWQQPSGKSRLNGNFPIEITIREITTNDAGFVIVIQDISLHRNEIDLLHHLSETDH
jgi:PAS domain S-box-containing protein